MRKASIWAMVLTGVLVASTAVATGAFSFFMWALALNGFMGQDRAVNASMITFVVLAGLAALASIALSVFSVYHLSEKRGWNAAGSAVLSTLVFSAAAGGLQLLSVLISVIIASQMRTTR